MWCGGVGWLAKIRLRGPETLDASSGHSYWCGRLTAAAEGFAESGYAVFGGFGGADFHGFGCVVVHGVEDDVTARGEA